MGRHIGRRRPGGRPLALRRRRKIVKHYHYRVRDGRAVVWSTDSERGGVSDLTPREAGHGDPAVAAAILADLTGERPTAAGTARLDKLLSGWGSSWDVPELMLLRYLASTGDRA